MNNQAFDGQLVTALADRQAMLDRDAEHKRTIEQLLGYRGEIEKSVRFTDGAILNLMTIHGVKRAVVGSTLLTQSGDILLVDHVHVVKEA